MFTVDELLAATRGRFLRGERTALFSGISIDSRVLKPGELFIALRGDRFDGHNFIVPALKAGAHGVLFASEAASPQSLALDSHFQNRVFIQVTDTLLGLQSIAGFHRSRFSVPLIAITGSNGKTTTKEMAACILSNRVRLLKNEGNLNNHIGVPLTLLRLDAVHQVAVIEIGINRPGELRTLCKIARPQVGLITNVGPTHLEFLGDVEGVARAKGEMLEVLTSRDTAILNADDPHFQILASKAKGDLITFGIERDADVMASEIRMPPDAGPTFRLTNRKGANKEGIDVTLPIMGKYNIYNALGAAAIAVQQGLDLQMIREGLEKFQPLSMRSQLVDLKGFHILNDAYNANPASMKSAIETLARLGVQGQKIAILGDMLELGNGSQAAHQEVGRVVAKAGIDYLFTMGIQAEEIANGALLANMDESKVFRSQDPRGVGEKLFKLARPGDYILVKGSRKMKMERILELISTSAGD
jgi:UDP-N-acetylmuramoyl-tripeptide--D-alanyl-D-alanine ligase